MTTSEHSRISALKSFYDGLSPRTQRALWALLAVEAVLVVAAERDLQRQPRERIRGPKFVWRLIATQNVLGPAAYYWIGRRRSR